VALCVLFAHTLVLLERWLATTTTTGPNRTPEERCKEHCTANCNEYTSAVDSRLGAHPCTMRSSDAMRAVELRSLPASFLVCELHGLACMRTACCNELGNAMRCEERKREESEAKGGEEAGGPGSASSSSPSSPRSRCTANHAPPSLALAPGTRGLITSRTPAMARALTLLLLCAAATCVSATHFR